MLEMRKSEGFIKVLWFSVGFVFVSVVLAHEFTAHVLSPRGLAIGMLLLCAVSSLVLIRFVIANKNSTDELPPDAVLAKRARTVLGIKVTIVVLVVLLVNALLQIGKGPLVPLLVGCAVGLCGIFLYVRTLKRLQK
jgi:hypothetical protein